MAVTVLVIVWLFGINSLVYSEAALKYIPRTVLQYNGCHIQDETMTCIELPKTIPIGVKEVIVMHYNGSFNRDNFKGAGWSSIKTLKISAPSIDRIDKGQLKGLDNVEHLSFSFPNFGQFASRVFLDTPNLKKLDLLDMDHIHTKKMIQAIGQSDLLQDLTEINFNPGQQILPPRFDLYKKVMKGFLKKSHLTVLNISRSMIAAEPLVVLKLLIRLDVVNISGCHVLDINEGNDFLDSLDYYFKKSSTISPLLSSLDISGVTSPYRFGLHQNLGINLFPFLIPKTVDIFANNVVHKDFTLSTSYNMSAYLVFTKRIYFRRNNLVSINCTYNIRDDNQLDVFDFSENKLEYIHPLFFYNMTSLKLLHLTQNRIYKMQYMNEFEKLFTRLTNLTMLFLDRNSISYIPMNMFKENIYIEILNLAENKLSTITFRFIQLVKLKGLDLTNNLIHTLDQDTLSKLSMFVHLQKNQSFELELQGNPIACLCQNVAFIKWLNNNNLRETGQYRCKYLGTDIPIDDKAVDKSKFLCKLTLVISFSVTGLVVLITILTVFIILLRRSRQRRKVTWAKFDFKYRIKNNLMTQKYICFIAYAGSEEEQVRRTLIDPLNEQFKQIVASDKQLIVTGNDFRPGFPIYEETYQFIRDSCVFIAVVSDQFCESNYCQGEMREAATQFKQVILVLLGHVNENNMSPVLLETFRRKTRAKIVKNEGGFQLVPDIAELADSVVQLAMRNK